MHITLGEFGVEVTHVQVIAEIVEADILQESHSRMVRNPTMVVIRVIIVIVVSMRIAIMRVIDAKVRLSEQPGVRQQIAVGRGKIRP